MHCRPDYIIIIFRWFYKQKGSNRIHVYLYYSRHLSLHRFLCVLCYIFPRSWPQSRIPAATQIYSLRHFSCVTYVSGKWVFTLAPVSAQLFGRCLLDNSISAVLLPYLSQNILGFRLSSGYRIRLIHYRLAYFLKAACTSL